VGDSVDYRTLGRTGLKISRLGFGAGQLQILRRKPAVSILSKAIEGGINYIDIDTDNKESFVREAVLASGRQILLTGKSPARSAKDMQRDLQGSLKAHNENHMDIYFIHALIDGKDLERRLQGPLKTLKDAQKQGRVHHLGVTSNRIEVIKAALETGHFDVCCLPYNLMHRIAEDTFDIIKEQNIGLISFLSFGGGVLLDPGWEEGSKPELTFHEPLRFLLSRKEIDCVLIGTNKEHHLTEIMSFVKGVLERYAGSHMGDDEAEAVCQKIISILGKDFCRGCKYCINDHMDNRLEIDRILRLKAYAKQLGYLQQARELYRPYGIPNPREFQNYIDPDWLCPYNLDIEQELLAAHKLLVARRTEEHRASLEVQEDGR